MKCEECLELLSLYLDKELDQKSLNALKEHLALCKNCMAVFHTLEKTISLSFNYYKKNYHKVPRKVSSQVFYEIRIRYKKSRF